MKKSKNINYKRWEFWLFIASLSCIIVATIYPFSFNVPEGFSIQFILQEFNFGSSVKDYLQNILLFIPLGISLGKIISRKYKNKAFFQIFTISLIISAIVSTSVEVTQFLIPIRTSNLTDIIYNSLGGTLGGIIYYHWEEIQEFLMGMLTGNPKKLSIKSLLYAIAGYCLLVAFGIWVLLVSVNLSNWDDDFYLAIGNEVTGDRPWNGNIRSLQFSDHILTQSEIAQVLEQPNNSENQLPSLITSLNFSTPQQFYQDKQQQLPNLLWQNNLSVHDLNSKITSQSSTTVLNSNQWLKTEQPASLLTKNLKQTNEFTLILLVATNQLNQTGPARILALSQGIKAHNLIVGQEGTSLDFRLRTPITGNNASQPEFIIPNVFNDLSLHQIIITFGDKKINFYIDKLANNYTFEFQPNNSFFIYFPWEKKNWQINLQEFHIAKYKLIFYSIIVTPLTILLTLLIQLLTKTSLSN